MSDPSSWTPVTPAGLSDDQLHKHLSGAGSAPAISYDKLGTLNTAQTADPLLQTATGKSSDYGTVASGTYDYSRDGHLKTMDALMASWTNAAALPSDINTSSATDALSIPAQGTQSLTSVRMLAVAETQKDPDETITVHGDPSTSAGGYIPGYSGSGLGGDANGYSSSRDQTGRMPTSITVTKIHSIPTLSVNGTPYVVAPNGQGLDTYQTSSGAWHALPYSMLQDAAERAAQHVLGISATDGIMSVAYNLAQNGNAGSSDFSQQVQSLYAYSSGAVADLSKVITDVQGRPTNAGDDVWIRGQQNALASGTQNLLQIRQSLAQWTANDGQYDSTFSTVHGFGPTAGDRNYAAVMIGNGWSVQDYRWSEAHSDRAIADIKSFYKIILGRDADQGGLATYTDALGSSMSHSQVADAIAFSAEAGGAINNFTQNNFGQVGGEFYQAGGWLIDGLAQAYDSLQSASSDTLQYLANSYKATMGQGNILQSLMPNTWQGWLELGAMVAVDLTPPGEAVAVGEIAVLGGEALLEKGFAILESRFLTDLETKTTQIISDGGKIISEDEKRFVIDDVAKRTAPHVEKHIDEVKRPDLSLRNSGINNVQDAENYIRETLNDAPSNPDRYEVASDIRNDRLAVWDKPNNTITLFGPKVNNYGGFGTVFKPENGYQFMEDIKNGTR